ncbi:MAG: DNA polymerase III subunit beta [Candidatus Dasytiphilus stammeri]
MQFIIEREQLLKPLQKATKLIDHRAQLIITRNILIQVSKNKLLITGTNIELQIMAYIKLIRPSKIGTVTVPARKLLAICNCFPKNAVINASLEKDKMVLASEFSKFTLATLPSSSFPKFEVAEYFIHLTISCSKLKYLIESIYFSMAHQDVRYYLNGMLFEIEGEILRIVATDGHRLAMGKTMLISNKLFNHSVIIPRKAIIELLRLLSDQNKSLQIKICSTNVLIHIDNYIFISKLIDGQFPNYHHVLHQNYETVLVIDHALIKQAFHRAAILSNEKVHSVHLCLRKNQLSITTSNIEQEKYEEKIFLPYDGFELDINLNVDYLLDVLQVLKSEKIIFFFKNSISSIQIEEQENKSLIYVIMPMQM